MDKSVVLQRERNHPKCCGGCCPNRMSVGIICSTSHCLGCPRGRLCSPLEPNKVNQLIHRQTEERAAQSVLAV